MKGLFYKEVYIMKGLYKSWAMGFLFVGIYALLFKNLGMIYLLPVIFGINGMLVSFSYDVTYQWEVNVLGMPVTRRQIICSKYLFILALDFVMGAAATAIVLLAEAMPFLPAFETGIGETLASGGALMLLLFFCQALQMPMICKLGVEKTRTLFVLLALSPLALLLVPWEKLPVVITGEMVLAAELAAVPAAAAAMLLSVWLSVRFYEGKEF